MTKSAHLPPGRTSVLEASDLGEFLAAALEMDVLIFLAAAIGGHLDLHPAGFTPEGIALLGWRNPYFGTGLRHLLGDGIDAHGWPLSGDGNCVIGPATGMPLAETANNQARSHDLFGLNEGELVVV